MNAMFFAAAWLPECVQLRRPVARCLNRRSTSLSKSLDNEVERCFRSIAKGRENWLQCGSHDAARHTAFMYSLVESCRMNDLDFGHYIETVLIRIQDVDTDFHGMLPNVIVLPETAGNVSVA